MGNKDGIMEAIWNKNTTVNAKDYYFSFAFGNEIALCNEGSFYILNCDSELWDKVNKFMEKERTFQEALTFWKTNKQDYEVSDWSAEF